MPFNNTFKLPWDQVFSIMISFCSSFFIAPEAHAISPWNMLWVSAHINFYIHRINISRHFPCSTCRNTWKCNKTNCDLNPFLSYKWITWRLLDSYTIEFLERGTQVYLLLRMTCYQPLIATFLQHLCSIWMNLFFSDRNFYIRALVRYAQSHLFVGGRGSGICSGRHHS